MIAAAEQLKSKGVDIADFGPGEPDFPTPDHIKQAAIKAHRRELHEVHADRRHPAAARSHLRVAQARTRLELSTPKECVVNVGGKHSIFNVVSVLAQAGDEVIIPAPYWVSYPDIVKYAGGNAGFRRQLAPKTVSA